MRKTSLAAYWSLFLVAVRIALGYMLREGSDPTQYPGYGPFIPIREIGDRVSAPRFDAVTPEMGQTWEQLGLQCRTPAARALFLDLAWCAKAGDTPGRLGSSAIDAYLELATTGTERQDDAEDKGWIRYLTTALTEPAGLNLRNRIAHGLVQEVTSEYALVILHIACFLSMLQPEVAATDSVP